MTVDRDGYLVTSIPRTAVDVSRGRDLPAALVVLDAAARAMCGRWTATPRRQDYLNGRLVLTAREQLRAVAPGPARLKEAIDLANPARESPAESLSAAHFHMAGLPAPLCQVPVVTASGTFFPDVLWPEHRLVGECDGAVKYRDPGAYVAEKRREQSFLDEGYRVVRWLGGDIMTSPWTVVDRVARALGV